MSDRSDVKPSQLPVETHSLDSVSSETELLNIKKPTGLFHKLGKLLWDSSNKSKEEQAFLLKLDVFFLSSIMLGYFIKTLNLNNINTAYINGMKEDLNMFGSQFNYMQSLWTAGYIIGQVPSAFILHRVPARYYLGGLEVVWTILTFLTVTCDTYQKMYAVRFFLGLTEAGFFPGIEILLANWYDRDELTKRASLFACSGVAASMVSGYLQAAIIKGLSHTRIKPYKWLFVLDGIISLPIAAYTMIANPNTPDTTTSWYFSKRDKEIALLRAKRFGAGTKKKFSLKSIKSVFKTWHVFVFPFIFLAYNNTCNSITQPTFQDWLKTRGYTPTQYNVYPTAVNGASIGFTLVFAWWSDYLDGLNWPFVVLYFVCQCLGCIFLAVWDIPNGLHWFSYFLVGIPTGWGQPMVFSWVNRLLVGDNEKRMLVVTLTNNLAYVTNAWVPIFTWNAVDMPEYFIGFTYTAVLAFVGLVLTILAWRLEKRDRNRSLKAAEYDTTSTDEYGDNAQEGFI